MMSHLPEHVPDTEILEMFSFADKDRDGRISYEEFLIMITPVRVPDTPLILARPGPGTEGGHQTQAGEKFAIKTNRDKRNRHFEQKWISISKFLIICYFGLKCPEQSSGKSQVKFPRWVFWDGIHCDFAN